MNPADTNTAHWSALWRPSFVEFLRNYLLCNELEATRKVELMESFSINKLQKCLRSVGGFFVTVALCAGPAVA